MGPAQGITGIYMEGVHLPCPWALPIIHGVGDGGGCPHARAVGP